MQMSRTRSCLRLTVILVLASAIETRASPLMELTGAAGSLHPFAARVLPSGPEAAYFNPALLPEVEDGMRIGAMWLGERLSVRLHDRPAGIDVTNAIYDARQRNPDGTTSRLTLRPLPTDALPAARGSASLNHDRFFMSIGLNRRFFDHRLAVGFSAILPMQRFQTQRPFYADEREQYFSNSLQFERIGDRTEANAFAFALAGRPLQWLSIGAGLVMAADSEVRNGIYLPDASDQSVSMVNAEVSVRMRLVPHFGLALEPIPPLRLTATLHLPLRPETSGDSSMRFFNYPYAEGTDALAQTFTNVIGFLPWRASFGASWTWRDPGPIQGAIAGGITWEQWSQYVDRHAERPEDAWHDTVSATLAGEVAWSIHRFAADVAFVPSPVPAQTGRSNYVDGHRLAVGAAWEALFPVGSVSLGAGVQVQVQRIFERAVTKRADAAHPVLDEFPDSVDLRTNESIAASAGLQTNNPGYPGFSSEGWLMGIGVSARMRY